MWNQYRMTAVPTQLAIFVACGFLSFYKGVPVVAVLPFFIVMQIGAILGAVWAARLKRRITPDNDRLPLNGA